MRQNKNKSYYSAYLLILFYCPFVLLADGKNNSQSFGFININTGFSLYNADISEFDFNSCCPNYLNGIGYNTSLGTYYAFGVSNHFTLKTSLGIVYTQIGLKEYENEMINIAGEPYNGEFGHFLQYRFNSVSFQQEIIYFPADFFFSFAIAANKNYNKKFLSYEELLQPKDRGVFADTGTRQRNRFSGVDNSIKNYTIFASISVGTQLKLFNFKNIYFIPEINYTRSFNSIVKEQKLYDNRISLNFGFAYNSLKPEYTDKSKEIEKSRGNFKDDIKLSVSAFKTVNNKYIIANNISRNFRTLRLIYPQSIDLGSYSYFTDSLTFNTVISGEREPSTVGLILFTEKDTIYSQKFAGLEIINNPQITLNLDELQIAKEENFIYYKLSALSRNEAEYSSTTGKINIFNNGKNTITSIIGLNRNELPKNLNDLAPNLTQNSEISYYSHNCKECEEWIINFVSEIEGVTLKHEKKVEKIIALTYDLIIFVTNEAQKQ